MDYLVHHGVKGQKWGVRRYQNEDGSYTEAGKKHRGLKIAGKFLTSGIVGASIYAHKTKPNKKDEATLKEEAARKEARERIKNDSKNRSTLSDKELRQKVERLRLEKELKSLSNESLYPGKKKVSEILGSVGSRVATTIAVGAILYGAKAAISGKFDANEMANAVFNGGPKKK